RGETVRVGHDIPIKVCPEPGLQLLERIILIKNDQNLEQKDVNIALNGECITYKYRPANLLEPAPYYAIGFAVGNHILSNSATFNVGHPKFGLIITLPGTNKNAHCGGKLRIKWKDPFKAYTDTFAEVALVNRALTIQFEPPAANVPVSNGEITVGIPQGLNNEHNYNVAIRVARNGGEIEHYYSDNFRISGCDSTTELP
ncbi:10373_t:CDS:2, partial [Paraglomus occultum]